MPRDQRNAPTDRIIRLLEEANEMEAWADHLHETLAAIHPELMSDIPAKPRLDATIEERMRQKLEYTRTIRRRNYMQRVRSASEDLGSSARSFAHIKRQPLPAGKLTYPLLNLDESRGLSDEAKASFQRQLKAHPALDAKTQRAIAGALPPGVSIEPSEDAIALEEDLKAGKLF